MRSKRKGINSALRGPQRALVLGAFMLLGLCVSSCHEYLADGDATVQVMFPYADALTSLPLEVQDQLRAEVSLEGYLPTTTLLLDLTTGQASGTFTVADDVAGDRVLLVEFYGAKDASSDEVLLFRSETDVNIVAKQDNDIEMTGWQGESFEGDIPFEFDSNRNGRSNWEDLVQPECDPAQVDSPVVVAPTTVGFESGVELGGFTRSFVVVENRSDIESVNFDLTVRMAPGVTVAPLEDLLTEGGKVTSDTYDSRVDLDENLQPKALAPRGQRVFAITFAPTSQEFLSGAISVGVETSDCNVRYGEIIRVLGNPDGAVPEGPEDYEEAVMPLGIQIDNYSGSISVMSTATLFSSAPALLQIAEADAGDVFGQDIDAAYILNSLESYSFSMVFNSGEADIDLYLYLLDSNFEFIGRQEPIDSSTNTGLGPEAISYEGSEDGDVYLFVGFDRAAEAASPGDIAKSAEDGSNSFSASSSNTPEFLDPCGDGSESDCVGPIEATGICPESYTAALACGAMGAPGSVTLRGTDFAEGATVQVGGLDAVCSTVTEEETFFEIRCAVPDVDQVSDEGTTVSVSLFNPDGQVATLVGGFTYLPPRPALFSITPSEGPVDGGTPISIRGSGFGGTVGAAPTVNFIDDAGNVFPAQEVEWRSSQQLEAIAPVCVGCSPGMVSVSLVNPDGQESGNELDFVYTEPPGAPPEIQNVTPVDGTRLGGTLVTMTGTGFVDGMSVRIGGTSATTVNVENEEGTEATFRTPPGAPGEASVVVVSPEGQVATWDNTFTYSFPDPVITNVSPANGPVIGGYQVSIWGSDFDAGVSLYFGDETAGQVAVVSSSLLTAIVPAASVVGTVDVKVVDVYGTEFLLLNGFEYESLEGDPPLLDGINPSEGTVRGNMEVTLTGANFDTEPEVFFGGVTAISVTALGDAGDRLRVVTPAHAAGQVDVVVRNVDGREAGGVTFGFIPLIPSIDELLPSEGPTAGGSILNVYGENFDIGAQAFVGDSPCENMVVINSRSISCRVPVGTAGPADVYVVNPDGTNSGTKVFTYQETLLPAPVLHQLIDSEGLPEGGYEVRLLGSHFGPNASVFFGETEAEVLSRQEDTIIEVIAPPGEPNSFVVVVVQNEDLQVGTQNFFYQAEPPPEPGAPTVSAISPDFGPTVGGTMLHIYGTEFDETTVATIGGAQCLNITVVGSGLMSCASPSGISGNTDVVVENDRGSDRLSGAFRYEAPTGPPPTISTLSPGQGREGDTVIIEGSDYDVTEGFLVLFGSEVASVSGSETELSVVVPSGVDHTTVTVFVQNPDGQVATSVFSYVPELVPEQPVISSIIPQPILCDEAEEFWVLGTGFGMLSETAGEIRLEDGVQWMPLSVSNTLRVSDMAIRVQIGPLADFGTCSSTEALGTVTFNFSGDNPQSVQSEIRYVAGGGSE